MPYFLLSANQSDLAAILRIIDLNKTVAQMIQKSIPADSLPNIESEERKFMEMVQYHQFENIMKNKQAACFPEGQDGSDEKAFFILDDRALSDVSKHIDTILSLNSPSGEARAISSIIPKK